MLTNTSTHSRFKDLHGIAVAKLVANMETFEMKMLHQYIVTSIQIDRPHKLVQELT